MINKFLALYVRVCASNTFFFKRTICILCIGICLCTYLYLYSVYGDANNHGVKVTTSTLTATSVTVFDI